MNRRRVIALVLGLLVCMVLLGRWAMHPDTGNLPAPVKERLTLDVPAPRATPNPTSSTLPETTDKQTPDSSARGIFRGRIIDALTREPVHEFDLQLYGPSSNEPETQPLARSFQSNHGKFEWHDVPAGNWSVFAMARGYQRFEFDGLQIVNGAATREIILPMRRGYALRGRVYDESSRAGIGSAEIIFRESHVGRYEGGFQNHPSVSSQQDGSFVMDGLPAGRGTLSVGAPNYAGRELDVVIAEKSVPVEIALSAGATIAGYLAAADGLTPATGRIALANLDESSTFAMPTGSAGEFMFEHLSPGRYRLAGRTNSGSGERLFTLTGNERMEGIVLAVRGGHTIRGRVSGLPADELQSVNIFLRREDRRGDPFFRVPVDERGAYVLPGVEAGRVHVSAMSAQRQATKQVEMPSDTDLTVDVEFPRGVRLTGHVTRAGKPLSGAWLSPLPTTRQKIVMDGTVTSQRGSYVFEDMPAGEYALHVDGYRSRTFQLTDDTVFDIDIPAAQLSGHLVEEGSQTPIVDARIYLWPTAAAPFRLHERSNHFGQFALTGLEPGDFVLTVYKPGYELYRTPIAYGSPIENLAIRLRPAKGVEVRVRDATSGKPIADMSVFERSAAGNGIDAQLHVDELGIGYLPSALAGSSLIFSVPGYTPFTVHNWNGQGLEVSLQRQSSP